MFGHTHMASATTATGNVAPRRHQEERHKKTISPYEAILSRLRVSNCQLMNGTIYDLWGPTCKHSSPPSRPSVDLLHIPDSFLAQTNVANHQYARAYNKPKMNLHSFERIACISPLIFQRSAYYVRVTVYDSVSKVHIACRRRT